MRWLRLTCSPETRHGLPRRENGYCINHIFTLFTLFTSLTIVTGKLVNFYSFEYFISLLISIGKWLARSLPQDFLLHCCNLQTSTRTLPEMAPQAGRISLREPCLTSGKIGALLF
jgi:hypothetical protein